MKVLITGNRGYVGLAVTKYLNSKNIEVYGIDNNFFSKKIKKNQTNKDIREIDEKILKILMELSILLAFQTILWVKSLIKQQNQ